MGRMGLACLAVAGASFGSSWQPRFTGQRGTPATRCAGTSRGMQSGKFVLYTHISTVQRCHHNEELFYGEYFRCLECENLTRS